MSFREIKVGGMDFVYHNSPTIYRGIHLLPPAELLPRLCGNPLNLFLGTIFLANGYLYIFVYV